MVLEEGLKGSLNPKHAINTIKYRIKFAAEHPDWFDPDGIVTFVGPQGSGKTLSAVQYVKKLLALYPECILVSNVQIKDFPIITFLPMYNDKGELIFSNYFDNNNLKTKEQFLEDEEKTDEDYKKYIEEHYDIYLHSNRVFLFNNNDDFMIYKNQEKGVIFLVDEIQLYLNSLESKNINMEVITQLSQQRKQRLHIVCTSQVFGRMAKPLREQFSCVLLCKCYLTLLQCNHLIDRDSINGETSTGTELSGQVKGKFWWFHSPELYGSYDTYAVIQRNKFVSGEQQLQNLYGTNQEVVVDQSKGGKKQK